MNNKLTPILYFFAFLLIMFLCYFTYTKYFAKDFTTVSNSNKAENNADSNKLLDERMLLLQQILMLDPCSIPPINILRNSTNEELKLIYGTLHSKNNKQVAKDNKNLGSTSSQNQEIPISPNATNPDTTTSDTANPNATNPNATTPNAISPNATTPRTTTPNTTATNTATLNTIQSIENNTVLIITDQSMGTGFIVAPNIIITNKHVVENINTPVLIFSKGLKTPQRAIIKEVSTSSNRDYAILEMIEKNNALVGLALCANIEKTEKVSTWGFPFSLSINDPKFQNLLKGDISSVPEIIYSEGVVSVIHQGSPKIILHTADTSPGNSGGPLTNKNLCVVGMSTLIQMDKESYRQTNIALGAKDIVNFLKEHGVTSLNYTP